MGRLLTVPRLVLFVLVAVASAVVVVVVGLSRTAERPALRRATVRVVAEIVAFGALLFVTFAVIWLLSIDAALGADRSGGDDRLLLSLAC